MKFTRIAKLATEDTVYNFSVSTDRTILHCTKWIKQGNEWHDILHTEHTVNEDSIELLTKLFNS